MKGIKPKNKKRKCLSLPAIRKFREAIVRGDLGSWLVKNGEKAHAGSVKVKYALKDKPWIIEFIARRNYDFRRH